VTPNITRPCGNDCGPGIETCTSEGWQSCVVPVAQRVCSSVCGSGQETCAAGKWGVCDAPLPKPPVLHTTIRDFRRTQVDFELPVQGDQSDRGMVEARLGADGTPVYAGNPTTKTTPGGKASFDVWYHDTLGVNETMNLDLQLAEVNGSPGLYSYDGRPFFPIDGQLFGNEGLRHNYHFTLATHTAFVYRGGETFSFAGDDDVWVFIAEQLAIDLGGLHSVQTKQVNLDQIAPSFGMTIGQKYPLDLFFAERHTVDSDFTVKTTIADVGSCQ
jgi:fibro-slime domain-containing protein